MATIFWIIKQHVFPWIYNYCFFLPEVTQYLLQNSSCCLTLWKPSWKETEGSWSDILQLTAVGQEETCAAWWLWFNFLFFCSKRKKEYLQHWPAQCTRKLTIREKGEITHFILSSSCSHGCFREAVICPEIFVSQCVVFALPGAPLCKEPDCSHQAPCAQVQGPRAQHLWSDRTARKWFSGIKSEELHVRFLPATCKTLTQDWCNK